MRILITGCRGQLGTELAKVLADGRSELGAVPDCYKNAELFCVDINELDISDAGTVKLFFKDNNFDLIINCAAMTNVDACETDFEAALKGNAIGPRNLAHVADGMQSKLVHISTDYVFGGSADKPYHEWDTPVPSTAYGKSKLLGEQYVLQSCRKAFIVRTAWLYGYAGSNFVKTILKLANEKGELKVVNDQRGCPTNAADLAHHILKIAASEFYGVYHCTGHGECSWYDFACEIVRLAGIPCEIFHCTTAEFPRPAPRPAYSSLDNLMLRCTVGDEMREWKDALCEFIQNYIERRRLP